MGQHSALLLLSISVFTHVSIDCDGTSATRPGRPRICPGSRKFSGAEGEYGACPFHEILSNWNVKKVSIVSYKVYRYWCDINLFIGLMCWCELLTMFCVCYVYVNWPWYLFGPKWSIKYYYYYMVWKCTCVQLDLSEHNHGINDRTIYFLSR